MVVWRCDICAKPGYVSPRTEPIMTKKKVKIETPDPKDPKKKVIHEIEQEVPETEIIRQQVTQTSEVRKVEIPKYRDLDPRAILVSLQCGMENIQKDFCKSCYDKTVKPEVDKLFDFLCTFKDR